jgi:hypothetical protein
MEGIRYAIAKTVMAQEPLLLLLPCRGRGFVCLRCTHASMLWDGLHVSLARLASLSKVALCVAAGSAPTDVVPLVRVYIHK